MRSIMTNAFIVVFFILFSNQMSAQWLIQNSGTQQTLRSVSFIDSLKGWVVGDSGTILCTTNGGAKWQKQTSNTSNGLNSVSFCDSMNGWAVGNGGTVINTSDGGKSWKRVVHDTADNIRNTKVICFDQNNIMISRIAWYGDYYGGGKLWYLKTDTMGSGWQDITPSSGWGGIFVIIDFDFISKNNGWVIKIDGLNFEWVPQVSKTTNGGNTWRSNQIPSTGYISFSDSSNGWLSSRSKLYEYADSNNAFNSIENIGFYPLESILRIGKIGYVSSYGSIMKTEDEGKHWVKQLIMDGSTIYNIKFLTSDIGWVVGTNGLIAHTVNGGVTFMRYVQANDYSVELNQNYPNPFNPSTQIVYRLPQKGFISLRIYDMLGREVETLLNEEKQAGVYSMQWDAREFASGVYFIKMHARNNVLTRKMLLLK